MAHRHQKRLSDFGWGEITDDVGCMALSLTEHSFSDEDDEPQSTKRFADEMINKYNHFGVGLLPVVGDDLADIERQMRLNALRLLKAWSEALFDDQRTDMIADV